MHADDQLMKVIIKNKGLKKDGSRLKGSFHLIKAMNKLNLFFQTE